MFWKDYMVLCNCFPTQVLSSGSGVLILLIILSMLVPILKSNKTQKRMK